MPQKYKVPGTLMPGFTAPPEVLKKQTDDWEAEIARIKAVKLKRKYLAEPEEINILTALEKLPDDQRRAAAEGMLLGRRFKKLGLVK